MADGGSRFRNTANAALGLCQLPEYLKLFGRELFQSNNKSRNQGEKY